MKSMVEMGYEVTVAVESAGNARYFRNKLLSAGIEVKIVNTSKFKVVNESVKKQISMTLELLLSFWKKICYRNQFCVLRRVRIFVEC